MFMQKDEVMQEDKCTDCNEDTKRKAIATCLENRMLKREGLTRS